MTGSAVTRVGGRRLAGICGGLPLALQITAALLAADPALTAAELADELADEIGRLEALRYDDGSGTSAPSVAAAFELSYRQLDEAAARVFRLLPVNPGPDVSTAAVAALAGWPAGEARQVIGRLARAHLVEARPARRAGGGCMTCCACTPASCPMPTPQQMSGSRPGTGCSATT